MSRSSLAIAAVAAVATAFASVASESAHAATVPTHGPLYLTSFLQNSRTDVRRNEMLEFRFSTKLRRGSVNDRTLFVDETGGTGATATIGARVVHGNVVRFDPQRTQRNYDDSRAVNATTIEKDHATGFPAFQDLAVRIPGAPSRPTIRGADGSPLAASAGGMFRTNGSFVDAVPGQPYFIGDHATGVLGFVPPKSGGLVAEDASIVLEFNEPLLPDTLDPYATVLVKRLPAGDVVPGYLTTDPLEPSGRRFLFHPSVGFGSDLVNQRGWQIQVTLTGGVTDLAGNPLKRPIVFPFFETRFAPGKPPCSLVVESFTDQTRMDPATVTLGAEWNTTEKGALLGGFPTTYPDRDVRYTGPGINRSRVAEPLVAATVPVAGGGGCGASVSASGSRVQMLYVPADVGISAAIVRIGWGPSSNALFGATHPDMTLVLGHSTRTSLAANLAQNFDGGLPQQVFRGPYTIQQALNINAPGLDDGYWSFPDFTTPFEWNGVNNLIVDVACQPAGTCQILRVGFPTALNAPLRRAVSSSATSGTADLYVDATVHDLRFKKRRRATAAVSLWIETGVDRPLFALPVVSPVSQPGGASYQIEMEGANGKADPFDVGHQIADPTTATGFTTTPSQIDGHRFFRFRVTMWANLATDRTVRLTSIQFPFCE